MKENKIKAIALLLPQFHPNDENNKWWGNGFTEWTNVTRSKPRFRGHYQPHLPADLGFYDLRLPDTRKAQADLAREHGIHGFCYYHYWFNGRRILERPFNEVLESGQPDFPFCLCWANENWTRTWSGGDKDILLKQEYCEDDDRAHIKELLPAFLDPRYIRIDDKPLFLLYRTELLPNPARTAAIWQEEARKAGLPGLYLARVENFERDIDPESIGFDAAVEFSPDGWEMGRRLYNTQVHRALIKMGLLPEFLENSGVFSYRAMTHGKMKRAEPPFTRFHCVSPSWDNSARRSKNARVLVDSTPELYENWLLHTAQRTIKEQPSNKQILFINAWNEWAEGAHLEPDQKWGLAYLEATQRALSNIDKEHSVHNPGPSSKAQRLYWDFRSRLNQWKV